MKNLNVLIVEDEILIGETISMFLEERDHNCMEIVVSHDEAIEYLNNHTPDLILLDVRLYGSKSGIDVAKFLQDHHPSIPYIFLTSQYDKRIVENAMGTNPSGYLAKPIQKETLWTTIEIAFNNKKNKIEKKSKIILADGNHSHIIFTNDILFIESEHVYVNVHLVNGKKIVSRETLQNVLGILDQNLFIQCHRSYIINKAHIDQFNSNSITIGKTIIPISRSKKKTVADFIGASTDSYLK